MAFTLKCPRCGHAMEEGYLAEDAGGTLRVTRWVQGPPERSLWTGLKLKGRAAIPVRTFRCTRCGFLESYAQGAQ